MPDGSPAPDPDTYADAWCKLGDQVAHALGGTWYMTACNPDLVFQRRDAPNAKQLRLPLDVARRIVDLHQRLCATKPIY